MLKEAFVICLVTQQSAFIDL